MKSNITKGLNEKDAQEVRGEFISSYHLRQQLIKNLNEEIKAIQASMRDLERYADASWPYYQADRLGQIRAYEKVIGSLSE